MKYLIYCTKAKPYLFKSEYSNLYFFHQHKIRGLGGFEKRLNGKIVAEFDGECEEIKYIGYDCYATKSLTDSELLRYSCLSFKELDNYLNVGTGYAIHIKNLKVFDKPMKWCRANNNIIWDNQFFGIPPQNMKGIWYEGERYILISIRPQWVCKILNGEKTIEIRKKILKECL